MIKPFWIPLVLVMTVCVGCKERQSSKKQVAHVPDTIVQKPIQIKFNTLTADAVQELNEFPEFKPLKDALDSLNYMTPETSMEQVSKLYERALDFEELLPIKFKTNPIRSRIKVLVTETGMLDQKINQVTPTVKKLNVSKKAIAIAYNSFVNQVNELYLEIPSNIAKELLRDSEVLIDSVPSLENVPNE